MRLKTDLIDIFAAIDGGTLEGLELEWDPRTALCLVLASNGYPGSYPSGLPVEGEVHTPVNAETQVFHAGTGLQDGSLVTAGGRVFGVTALGRDLVEARALAYAHADRIRFEGCSRREDIGA